MFTDAHSVLWLFQRFTEQPMLILHHSGTLVFPAKISDFGVIHWEEGMSDNLFMENLTARGNTSYIPPETFTQCPDPPGTPFDVYRWLGIFEIAPLTLLLFFSDSVHNPELTQCNLALHCTRFTLLQATGSDILYIFRMSHSLSLPFNIPWFPFISKGITFLQRTKKKASSFFQCLLFRRGTEFTDCMIWGSEQKDWSVSLLWSFTALALWFGRFWHNRNHMQVGPHSLEMHYIFTFNTLFMYFDTSFKLLEGI